MDLILLYNNGVKQLQVLLKPKAFIGLTLSFLLLLLISGTVVLLISPKTTQISLKKNQKSTSLNKPVNSLLARFGEISLAREALNNQLLLDNQPSIKTRDLANFLESLLNQQEEFRVDNGALQVAPNSGLASQ